MLAERLSVCDPVAVAEALSGEAGFLWLDSPAAEHPGAKYSYICIWPVSRICLDKAPGAAERLRTWLADFRAERTGSGPPFQGGAVGYIAYDFVPALMPRFLSRHVPDAASALEFGLYDTVIAFDHATGEATAFSAGLSEARSSPNPAIAADKIRQLKEKLAAGKPAMAAPEPLHWAAQTSSSDYMSAVRKAQDYILSGDIYQANIAGLWTARALSRGQAFAHYLSLRQQMLAPFSAFGVFEGRMIASFSPERLIAATGDGYVRAEPIKGTIRRGATDAEDTALRAELAASAKDRAENVMIVDLLRNDLSRVCEPASVNVSSLCRVETFANLHHLVSTIEGQLKSEHDAADLIEATFPGGSITGAPKLRAVEVIDRLEPAARGVFCGSLGWIGYDGAVDFSILIRTLDLLPAETRLWAGAGITLLSDPAAEYDEICLKAARIMAPLYETVQIP